MKTTTKLADCIKTKVKHFVAEQWSTLVGFVNALLQRGAERSARTSRKLKELPSFRSGRATIDISNRDTLFDFFDHDKT